MESFLYRFRPIENLIGTDNIKSELLNHYVYFSSPKQLNAPLEGHREIFWNGDEVVWKNLFRHYIKTLILRNAQYFSEDFAKSEFPILPEFERLSRKPLETVNKLVNEFSSTSQVKTLIRLLKDRKVGKNELLLILRSLHLYAMHLTSKLLVELGAIQKGYGINGEDPKNFLKAPELLIDYYNPISSKDDINSYISDEDIVTIQSCDLIANYNEWKKDTSKNWITLSINFPQDYLDSIPSLCMPPWYAACFMEACSDSSLWGTYGNNHQGVCLKFKIKGNLKDSTMEFMTPLKRPGDIKWWQRTDLKIMKVKYSSETPNLDFFRTIRAYSYKNLLKEWYKDENGSLSECHNSVFNDYEQWGRKSEEDFIQSVTSKTWHWDKETEYRILFTSKTLEQLTPEERSLQYDFKDLQGIIFGIRTPSEKKYQIIEILIELCEKYSRQEFDIYQAYYDKACDCIRYNTIAKIKLNNGEAKIEEP
ncbi:DUF2971 domain-containing protein (plasmid) [Pseudomonas luteola]|uniref:DUF2971 domain-containing protein n=1 Tax=Pseudomonas luteola TaxID=47886 RepID=UPI0038909116